MNKSVYYTRLNRTLHVLHNVMSRICFLPIVQLSILCDARLPACGTSRNTNVYFVLQLVPQHCKLYN